MKEKKVKSKLLIGLGYLLLVGLADCTSSSESKTTDKTPSGKADAWNYANNPQRFLIDLEYNIDELSKYIIGYAEQTPWPSDYWPYINDSTNSRYHGQDELSPVEKYDMAFNSWIPNMELSPLDAIYECQGGYIADSHDAYYEHLGPAAKWQHENKGIYRVRNGRDDDFDGLTDECSHGDQGDFDGIESWWGLCHAWVPASILEPEPARAITVNGVRFSISDIKALLISIYNRTTAVSLGGKCNEFEVGHDEFGRIIEDACRDTNAGAFHVIITNLLGIHHRAFAEDRTMNAEIWNQPLLGYQILEQREISEQEAMLLLGRPGEKYTEVFNSPEAVSFNYVKMDTDYVTESASTADYPLVDKIAQYTRSDQYEYILELDKDDNIVGGEWLGYSVDTHPDYLWMPVRYRDGGNPYMTYDRIKQLVDLSLQEKSDSVDWRVAQFGGKLDLDIPDNDPAGIVHEVQVAEDFLLAALKVRVEIAHSNVSDLKISLTKDDTSVVLQDRVLSSDSGLIEVYDLREFVGQSAKGTWRLSIADLRSEDIGSLLDFTMVAVEGLPLDRSYKTYSSTNVLHIPDNNEQGVQSVIAVSDPGTIKSAKVRLNIDHTHIGDLFITLKHRYGGQILHSFEGGESNNIYKDFRVDSLNGMPLSGDWILTIIDPKSGDKGVLNSWAIEVGI
jgi:subtilisin-like proprotein convertase family protein